MIKKKSAVAPLYWRLPKVFKTANIDNSHNQLTTLKNLVYNLTSIQITIKINGNN